MNKKTIKPKFVLEYHYSDGDTGVYADPVDQKALATLWDGSSKNNRHKPTHIIIRPNTKIGQVTSDRLIDANIAAQLKAACDALITAYMHGAYNGAHAEWEELDWAYELALDAFAMILGCKPEEVGEKVLPRPGDGREGE